MRCCYSPEKKLVLCAVSLVSRGESVRYLYAHVSSVSTSLVARNNVCKDVRMIVPHLMNRSMAVLQS